MEDETAGENIHKYELLISPKRRGTLTTCQSTKKPVEHEDDDNTTRNHSFPIVQTLLPVTFGLQRLRRRLEYLERVERIETTQTFNLGKV